MKVKKDRKLTFRLPEEQYNSLERLSKDSDVSVATIVRWAVKDYIKE